jgi:hypothetical protein
MNGLPVTGFAVRIQVKGKADVYGPTVGSREEADRQIAEVRRVLGTGEAPDVPGVAIVGENIVSADVVQREMDSKLTFEDVEEMRRLVDSLKEEGDS